MENWQLFSDPRFIFVFKYPSLAPNGEFVDRVESEQAGMVRVHILAPKSREVYFEVSKYYSLTPEAEYQRHREYLENHFHTLAITELKETLCASLPAWEYSFEWDQGVRNVVLVEQAGATYRIIYNPRYPINLQIFSTVEWINFP